MRQIEFRAKLLNNRGWAYGNLNIHSNDCVIMTPDNTPLGRYGKVDPETIGQYTGLKDKNGKKIFEGDIVKYTRTNMYAPTTNFHNQDLTSLHKIYWNEEKHQFYQEHYTCPELKCIGGGSITFEDERADENIIEVVGNIYDNLELLEV